MERAWHRGLVVPQCQMTNGSTDTDWEVKLFPDLEQEMSTDPSKKKQYGLIVRKKVVEKTVRPIANVFGDDDDEESEKVDVSYKIHSASTIRVQKHAERLQEMAIAEDPTVFDYDASYDQIQAARDEKIAERKKADKERKSKYALDIIKAHKRRELEQHSREERQQQKERLEEGDQFADKEVFVTNEYRRQMEEVQKFREEEAYEKRFNELTSVEHQKAWQAGFGRTLLSELARGEQSLMQKGSLHDSSKDVSKEATKTKIRNVRQRQHSDAHSSDELETAENAIAKTAPTKRSIYSDDEDEVASQFQPPQRNFPGELTPGLNRVVKAPTRSEKLRERQFTHQHLRLRTVKVKVGKGELIKMNEREIRSMEVVSETKEK
ncbi:Nuclear speckle splicing regulatory protein 1, partial [Parelaphostrongylus tenuis]